MFDAGIAIVSFVCNNTSSAVTGVQTAFSYLTSDKNIKFDHPHPEIIGFIIILASAALFKEGIKPRDTKNFDMTYDPDDYTRTKLNSDKVNHIFASHNLINRWPHLIEAALWALPPRPLDELHKSLLISDHSVQKRVSSSYSNKGLASQKSENVINNQQVSPNEFKLSGQGKPEGTVESQAGIPIGSKPDEICTPENVKKGDDSVKPDLRLNDNTKPENVKNNKRPNTNKGIQNKNNEIENKKPETDKRNQDISKVLAEQSDKSKTEIVNLESKDGTHNSSEKKEPIKIGPQEWTKREKAIRVIYEFAVKGLYKIRRSYAHPDYRPTVAVIDTCIKMIKNTLDGSLPVRPDFDSHVTAKEIEVSQNIWKNDEMLIVNAEALINGEDACLQGDRSIDINANIDFEAAANQRDVISSIIKWQGNNYKKQLSIK